MSFHLLTSEGTGLKISYIEYYLYMEKQRERAKKSFHCKPPGFVLFFLYPAKIKEQAMNDEELRYTEEHLWVFVEKEIARFGITDHAQNELEDIVYVELPAKGKKIAKGDIVCTIESVKTTNDLSCPLSGSVHSVNSRLRDEPETINRDPYGDGWIFTLRMDDPKQVESLLDYQAYKNLVES